MSTFNEIEITTPYGDTDNALELNIDSSSDAYVLQNVIKLPSTYTFSIWYRTESDSQITFNVLGESEIVDSTTSWNKFVKTVTVETLDETSIYILPSVGVNSYFYEGYLVEGITDTSWTPAPEDVEQSITNVSSQYTQLADKFNWVVKSGTSSSDFTITDRLISLTSTALNIDALTTFKNSAENGTSTVINGGAIKTNTITATQIAANAITTDKLKANSVTTAKLATDAIKSTNYSYSSGNFSSAGTFLDLSTGLLRSKNFTIDSSGNAYFKGNVQANAGYIGGTSGWAITTNTITGNENSKIISGILESSNFVENSTGVQMNLNTGIIKGDIEATSLSAKDSIKIYNGNVKRNIITGSTTDEFYYTTIGCDLTVGAAARPNPSIIFSKEISDGSAEIPDLISINTTALDINSSDISLNGDTYINGKITGTGQLNLGKNLILAGQIELSNSTPYIDFHYGSSTADFTSRIIASGNGILDIYQSGTWGNIRIDSTSGQLYPHTNGGYSLGSGSNRFYILRVTNGVDNSSIVDIKTQINPFTSALSEIEKTDVFNYKLKDSIKRNGDDIVHTGFVIGEGYNCSDYLISESKDGIDLYSAIGVTFGGVKELYEIVKEQQKIIEELQNRIKGVIE